MADQFDITELSNNDPTQIIIGCVVLLMLCILYACCNIKRKKINRLNKLTVKDADGGQFDVPTMN